MSNGRKALVDTNSITMRQYKIGPVQGKLATSPALESEIMDFVQGSRVQVLGSCLGVRSLGSSQGVWSPGSCSRIWGPIFPVCLLYWRTKFCTASRNLEYTTNLLADICTLCTRFSSP